MAKGKHARQSRQIKNNSIKNNKTYKNHSSILSPSHASLPPQTHVLCTSSVSITAVLPAAHSGDTTCSMGLLRPLMLAAWHTRATAQAAHTCDAFCSSAHGRHSGVGEGGVRERMAKRKRKTEDWCAADPSAKRQGKTKPRKTIQNQMHAGLGLASTEEITLGTPATPKLKEQSKWRHP